MVTILPETGGNLLAIKASAIFTLDDFRLYKTLVAGRLLMFDEVRVYFEMEAFRGWSVVRFFKTGFLIYYIKIDVAKWL